LIALQINNWNEWRKERVKEKEVLLQLSENLEMNCIQLELCIERNISMSERGEILINHFENKYPYHDSIGSYFWSAKQQWKDELPIVGYETFFSLLSMNWMSQNKEGLV